MATHICERATEDAIDTGCALLRYIQPNDLGLTGSHQSGFYLPKPVRELYTDIPPEPGTLLKQPVRVHWWQIGEHTNSNITWYGKGTRREYRLTGFGRGFQFMQAECLGDLLVLIPHDRHNISAYVLDIEDDIQRIQADLGLDVIRSWGAYTGTGVISSGTPTACIRKHTKDFVETLEDQFPIPTVFSETAREIFARCVSRFDRAKVDGALVGCLAIEYDLFRQSEEKLYRAIARKSYPNVGKFMDAAIPMINRRKIRAGLSLENHVDYLLTLAGIPHDMRPVSIRGRSDVVIPGVTAYEKTEYPGGDVCVVGIKTTCKDRWRQVLHEAPKVKEKHILTTQRGISVRQMDEMHEANITLVVPTAVQKSSYPKGKKGGKSRKRSKLKILSFEEFIGFARGIAHPARQARD